MPDFNDNLDKLGSLGIANYFIKAGLRGNPLSPRLLSRLTVELTYARHAPQSMYTPLGREWATRRAQESIGFVTGTRHTASSPPRPSTSSSPPIVTMTSLPLVPTRVSGSVVPMTVGCRS